MKLCKIVIIINMFKPDMERSSVNSGKNVNNRTEPCRISLEAERSFTEDNIDHPERKLNIEV